MTARSGAAALLVAIVCMSVAPAIAQPMNPLLPPAAQGSDRQALPAPITLPVPLQPEAPAAGSATGSAAAEEAAAAAHTPEATKNNTLFAIKVIAGLVALLALAYLGGHRKVVRFQERLGIG